MFFKAKGVSLPHLIASLFLTFRNYTQLKKNEMATIKKNTLYWIGRPEVSQSGRFGKRVTTYTTAVLNDNGEVVYGSQSYSTLGKLGIPNNVIKVTKAEFEKMLKSK